MADDSLAARLKRGQGLYRQKQYTKALECFDDLVDEYADPPLSLFDCRAATQAKLQKYNGALRDGRRMIQMAKTDATGYLRTGQVLVQMDKPEKAWEIYQMGLRHVPNASNGSKMLYMVANKLAVKMAPRKATDPFAQLPVELVHRIIGYLSFAQMVGLCRVSKGWRDFVTTSPSLWKRMDFTTRKRFVSANAMKNYFRYARGQISHLIITANLPFSLFARNLAEHCKQLQHVEINIPNDKADGLQRFLSNGLNIKTIVLGKAIEISPVQVWKILSSCYLERAEFWGVCGIGQYAGDSVAPEAIQDGLPRLQGLRVLCLDCPTGLHWSLEKMQYSLWLPTLSKLEKLTLGGCYGGNFTQPDDFTQLSRLLSLEVRKVSRFRVSLPPSIIDLRWTFAGGIGSTINFDQGQPQLTTLHLYDIPFVESDLTTIGFLENLAVPIQELVIEPLYISRETFQDVINNGYLDEVRVLSLRFSGIRNDELAAIASRCSHLHTLRLQGSPGLTGVGVRDVAEKKGVQLQELDIRGCDNIGRDAIDLILSRGVKVRYGNMD